QHLHHTPAHHPQQQPDHSPHRHSPAMHHSGDYGAAFYPHKELPPRRVHSTDNEKNFVARMGMVGNKLLGSGGGGSGLGVEEMAEMLDRGEDRMVMAVHSG